MSIDPRLLPTQAEMPLLGRDIARHIQSWAKAFKVNRALFTRKMVCCSRVDGEGS